jgi:hypothetical protein
VSLAEYFKVVGFDKNSKRLGIEKEQNRETHQIFEISV